MRCPSCEKKFPWEPTLGTPEHCPLCGYRTAHDRADDDIVMPSLRSARMAATDGVYRDLEKSSEHRMRQAAQMAGCDVSDMAGLKITNLRDTKEGEIAAPSVAAETARLTVGQNGPKFQGGGAEMSPEIASGAINFNGRVIGHDTPRAGMRAQANIQRMFGK